MKKCIFLATLLLPIFSFAQQDPWILIDSLEVSGRVRSADSLVKRVLQTARRNKDHGEFVKAKLYHYKLYQVNHENSNQYILQDINQSLAVLPSPFKNVLLSYKAGFLNEYLTDRRWRIRNRTEVNDPHPYDLETWSIENLRDTISNSYDLSLQQEKQLVNTPTDRLSELIFPNELNRKYKPTVFDLLAYRALNYYSNTSNFGGVKGEFAFTSEALYAPTEAFVKLDLSAYPQETSAIRVLQTYRKLETLHNDPTPKVFAELERLDYVNAYFRGNNKWQLYDRALEELSRRYEEHPVQALILFTRAKSYYERSTETDDEGKLLYPDFLKKAVALAERISREYENSDSAQQAFRLISTIKAAELRANIPQYLSSNDFGRIYLSYKSLDSIQLKIIKVPHEYERGVFYNTSDSLILSRVRKEPVYQKLFSLPQWEDYNRHSTELMIPKLKIGNYLVFITQTGNASKKGFSYGFVKVTDLVISQTTFENHNLYRVVDRSTGRPKEKVNLKFYNRNNDLISSGLTNKKGEHRFKKEQFSYFHGNLMATKDGDTLSSNYWSGSYPNYDENNTPEAKSLVYLDRAIYRPGQKVHFKGVLLEQHNKKVRAVPNEYVEVFVEDPNGEEVLELRLKTNKFGSFSGEFILPASGITGQFRIFTSEDIDSETLFWNRIWEDGDYNENPTYFSVEEYKRPTFELSFEPVTESFKLQDTVIIEGKAESYMGATLSDRQVKFSVERQKMQRYWWRDSFEEAVVIVTDSVMTDEKGHFSLRFPALVRAEDLEDEQLIYRYNITAEVTDITGETREATTSIRLGNKNLLVNLQASQNLKHGDTLKPKILATNLNDEPVPVSGKLKIYKLRGPDRILRERWWEAPEIQQIPKEEFERMFPEEPYKSAISPEEWPKGDLLYESQFTTEGRFEPEIPLTSAWASGKYLIEVEVSSGSNFASAEKTFDLLNPADKYLPDNQRISVSFLNEDFTEDGKIKVLIQTAYKNLHLHAAAYDGTTTLLDQQLTVDGRHVLEIPLKNVISEAVQIQVTGIKNNAAIQEILHARLPQKKFDLIIETETFRNKIAPGQEETWSFKVSDEEGKIHDAEVLASMYDASLDQFRTAEWSTAHGFYSRTTSFPSFNIFSVGGTHQLINRFNYIPRFRENRRLFDRLNLFGFHFGQPNSYQYRLYLARKKTGELSAGLSGNTRGRITDAEGLPLPGVSVVIQGTTTGTQTDFDGEFGLDTKPGDVLTISYVGFASENIFLGKDKELYLVMEQDTAMLEEVVTVGYGTVEEEAEMDMENHPAHQRNAASLLQGKVAGVEVSASTAPGQGNMIRIRGAASADNNNIPLYVVDGVIVNSSDLNENDLLNVQILEGTAATALYGARGANGVVIITTKKGMADLQQVEARKNLDETAFFYPHLTLDKDGKLQFSFTSPEALTRWKLRLLGHTANWTTGSYENTVVTQKELNVSPNPPRFLREGDEVIFKAKIANLSEKTLSGNSVLQLFDAITMEPIDSLLGNHRPLQNFNLAASNSGVVSWKLQVPQGVQAVTYRILAKAGDFSDGEENLLPVLSNRMLVKESLPFFVRAGETETYEFKNLKENNSESLEHHKFTLEYSSNPAWTALQSLPYLMEFEHECAEQIFSRLYANSLSGHILNSHPKIKDVFKEWKKDSLLVSNLEKNEDLKSLLLAETPWVRDATSEAEKKQRLAQLFDLEKLQREQEENILKLKRLQYSSGAFPWFAGGDENPFITRHIAAGFGHLQELGVEIDGSEEIVAKAIKYLDNQLIIKEQKSHKWESGPENFYGSLSNLHYLYARSFFLIQHPMPEKAEEIIQKILEKHKNNWLLRDLYDKGLLALVLHRFGEENSSREILRSLEESAVRSREYGMYWKENVAGWFWYRAPIETQALLIEAFSEIKPNSEAVEEMKIWLLQNKRTTHWPTTKATTEATYALLMQGEDWLQEDTNVSLFLSGKPIAEEMVNNTKAEAGTGYFQFNWKGEEVDNSFGEIGVKNGNSTAGYGGAYWQYFEDLDKIKTHTESPLNVEKELYLNVSGSTGKSLQKITPETQLKTGDLVTVRLVVRTTADMEFIHLKDMRASGFEPTDVLSEYKRKDGTGYYQSTRDAATHFFFDRLNKGTYVLEYTLRANNAGNFSNGITTISSMYAPEFSGHTKGIRVEIGE